MKKFSLPNLLLLLPLLPSHYCDPYHPAVPNGFPQFTADSGEHSRVRRGADTEEDHEYWLKQGTLELEQALKEYSLTLIFQ